MVTPVTTMNPSLALAPPGLRATTTIRAGFMTTFHSVCRVAFGLFVDADVVSSSYLIAEPTGTSNVALTFPVRPVGVVEIGL
jgi:hypothetical protein